MSIKDKIAMWNNMGQNNEKVPPPPAPKYNIKPQQEAAKMVQPPKEAIMKVNPPEVKSDEIVKPSQMKGNNQTYIKAQLKKEPVSPVKQVNEVKKQVNEDKQNEIEIDQILKPSQMNKNNQFVIRPNPSYGLSYYPQPSHQTGQLKPHSSQQEKKTYQVEEISIKHNVKQEANQLNQYFEGIKNRNTTAKEILDLQEAHLHKQESEPVPHSNQDKDQEVSNEEGVYQNEQGIYHQYSMPGSEEQANTTIERRSKQPKQKQNISFDDED